MSIDIVFIYLYTYQTFLIQICEHFIKWNAADLLFCIDTWYTCIDYI